MRVLVITTPVSTHFTPLVPLVWALRDAGHEVLAAVQPDVVDAARAAGLDTDCVGDWFFIEDQLMDTLPDGKRPVEIHPRLVAATIGPFSRTWATHAKYLHRRYLDVAREFGPDLILSDPFEYAGLIVGGVLGVPVAHHRWGVDPLSGVAREQARPMLARVCARLDLPGLAEPSVIIDPCPPSLQEPNAEPSTPLRYEPDLSDGKVPFDLLRKWRGSPEVRRVTVSLGARSLALNGIPHMRRILWAFDGMPGTEAIAPIEAHYRDMIGAVPANVTMIDPIPLLHAALHPLLATCAAAVHHGGAGTMMAATAFGLPQLVLPQLGDQYGAGDQIVRTGAGIALDTAATQDDPRRLRESLEALLSNPAYAKAAGELRHEIESMPEPSRVVADLSRLAEASAARARSR